MAMNTLFLIGCSILIAINNKCLLNLFEEIKAAKGVLKKIKDKDLIHENYKTSLFEKKLYYHSALKIKEDKHQLFISQESKNTLSSLNDKKYIIQTKEGFLCYSFGHKDLEQKQKTNLKEDG